MKQIKAYLQVVRRNPAAVLGAVLVAGQLAFAQNPLVGPMNKIQQLICGAVEILTGPLGAALAVGMLGLGFAGMIIGNRNSMGLIISAIAGGALLLGAKAFGTFILGQTCP